MEAVELFNADDLTGALSAAKQQVRSDPASTEARGLLAQLFCFDGDWKRADVQFDTIGQQDAEMLVGMKLLRQLVRGELARQQFYFENAVPDLTGDPDANVTAIMDALLCLSENQPAAALEKLQPVHQHSEKLTGKINGQPFVGGRDLDDVISGNFEVLTSNGKFYWLPMDQVINIDFRGYERLQDRIWRSAAIRVEGFNTEGEVYFPVSYCCDAEVWKTATDDIKVGSKTDWYAVSEQSPVRGMGPKSYVFGDNQYSIMELENYSGPLADDD